MKPLDQIRTRALLIIVLIAMTGLMGIDIHLASLPFIMQALQCSKSQIQQSITLYIFGMGSSLLFAGPLSDKFGRRPVVIAGLLLATLASLGSTLTNQLTPFLVTRFIQGFGAGCSAGLGRTMSVDVFHDSPRTPIMSYFSTLIGLSPLLAPVLGGYLQHYFGWHANFVMMAILFGLLLLIYTTFCPETNRHINPQINLIQRLPHHYWGLIKHRPFVMATLLCGTAMTANIAYATLSPFIFQWQYHVSPIHYGWLTMAAATGMLLGRFFNGKLIQRFGNLNTLKLGLAGFIFSGIWLCTLMTLGWHWLSAIIGGVFITLFGQPLISGNSMILALRPQHTRRGIAGALFGSFQYLVIFGATVTISLFNHGGVLLLGITYLSLGLIGYLLTSYLND